MKLRSLSLISLVLAIILPATVATAATAGGIYGQIINNAGKGLPNVAVTLTQNGFQVASVKSGSDGAYNLPVAPGAYSISFVPPTSANSTLFAYDIVAPLTQQLKVMLTTPTPGRAFVTGNVAASSGEPMDISTAVGFDPYVATKVDVNGDYRLTPTAGSKGMWRVEGALKSSGMRFKLIGQTSMSINQDIIANFVLPIANQRVRLITDKGTPVANALVQASVGNFGTSLGNMKPIEGLGAFQGYWFQDIYTDANGYATFPYMQMATPTVAAFSVNTPASYKYDSQLFTYPVGSGDITLTLTKPVALISGTVKDQTGRAIDQTAITFPNTWTPVSSSGTYAIATPIGNSGTFNLLYRGDGSYKSDFAFNISSTSNTTIKGDLVQNFTIPVENTKVTVVDPSGKPMPNTWVSYTIGDNGGSNAPGTPLGSATLTTDKKPFTIYDWSQATTDANGVAYLTSIHLDTQVMGRIVAAPPSGSAFAPSITYPTTGQGKDLTITLPVPTVSISGKLTFSDISQVRSPEVRLPDYLGDGSGGSATPNASGNYSFNVKKGYSGGWYVSTQKKDALGNWAPLYVNIFSGQKKTFTSDLTQNFNILTTKIPVKIVNPQGQGLANVSLMIASTDSAGPGASTSSVTLIPGDLPATLQWIGRATTDANGLAMVPAAVMNSPASALLEITPDPMSRYPSRNVYITVGDNSQNLVVLTILKPVIVGATVSVIGGVRTATLTGDNMLGAISVAVGTTNVAKFTVVNNTTITFPVPQGATSSTITVTNGGGSATSGTIKLN